MDTQRRLIIILGAILLAVITVSAIVLWLLPSTSPTSPGEPSADSTAPNGVRFNTSILERSAYTSLDQRLIREKLIPVQPPATIGKANPFL